MKQNMHHSTAKKIEKLSPLVSKEHSQGPLTRCQFFIEKRSKINKVTTVLKNKKLLSKIAI